MNDRQAATFARAIELDDPFPDDICPGCRQNIAGWAEFPAHMLRWVMQDKALLDKRKSRRDRTPLPFLRCDSGEAEMCPWRRDYLNARSFRREYIARYAKRVA